MKAIMTIAAGMTVAILKETQNMLHKVNDIKFTSNKSKVAMPLVIQQWNDLDIEKDPDPIRIIKECKQILKALLLVLKLDYDANLEAIDTVKKQIAKSIKDDDDTAMDVLVQKMLELSLQNDAETDKKLMAEIVELLEKYSTVSIKHSI